MIFVDQLLNITSYDGAGIGGTVEGREYTILLLNYLPRLSPDTITDMQRHLETDESFILLQGKAILFAAEGEDAPGELQHYVMEPGVIYTVPKNIWHTQAMTEDAKILLVENSGTVAENSPRCPLTQQQREQIMVLGNQALL